MITLNWIAGWSLILTGFIVGAGIGLFFHRDDFAGGYQSWRRRLLRLGHIACGALGMLNLIVSLAGQASMWLVAGGVLMPAVCFLAAWRKPFRHLFFVPVACLAVGVVALLCSGASVMRRVAPVDQSPALHRSAATTEMMK